ncbi:putative beta-lactamase [Infundibulicybe gibba]|nr:putative beta-lactamase [Infundibulicybe gibba]
MIVLSTSLLTLLLASTVHGVDSGGILNFGTPESTGLLGQPFKDLEVNVSAYLAPPPGLSHPMFPGATVIVGHQNTIVSHFAVGLVREYQDINGTKLNPDAQVPALEDTIYDMASLTKMFTTIVTLQQIERSKLDLNTPVFQYLPEFATNGKQNITILMLLTHTSGFDADPVPDLWTGYATYEERKTAIIEQRLINVPGKVYLYSDLNFMTLQFVLEAITNIPFDQLVHDEFTAPLGMIDTQFNRGNKEGMAGFVDVNRVAPTEFQIAVLGETEPSRPQPVWGTVHDENAWSLGGIAGHADDLNNGTYGGARILQPSSVDMIFHNYNTAFPGNAHGLGFELDQNYWSGPMRSLQTAGHTGFTGTSMVIDRPSNTFFVLLSNRVHPSRTWSDINVVREMLGYFVARALGRNV